MTEEKLNEWLLRISKEVNKDEYPEIDNTISFYLDLNCEELVDSVFFIACELDDADGAMQLPVVVADFIIEAYKEAIEEGNSDAACNLGVLYYTGRAGEQDYIKAVKYFKIAVDGGCKAAQENLGYCYYYGKNMEVDYEKAFKYFALGAFEGNIRSLFKIGDMYKNGYYVDKDEEEAFFIFRRCDESLDEDTMAQVGADVKMRMGDCYFEGIGTEIDYVCARKYYGEAEMLFYKRLLEGDFLIKECYEKVKKRLNEVREKLEEELPKFEWREKMQ